MQDYKSIVDKGKTLLEFLKDFALLRRQRIPTYKPDDKIFWFSEIPKDSTEIRCPFVLDSDEMFEYWLQVRKSPMPKRPPLPEIIKDWIRPEDLENIGNTPELLQEITIIVEEEIVNPETQRIEKRKISKLHRLQDHSEVEDAWLEYLINQWEPWAKKMEEWQRIQRIYENIDFMRRRLEESEERYELILAVGLLCWRDSTGAIIKRHLLTAPAEIEFDAARGVFSIVPAANFESFRVELDMLELPDQPKLEIQEKLEDLDIQAWDINKVGEILREIANRLRGDAQVDEHCFNYNHKITEVPHIYFAPAIILRERQPTSFEEVVNQLLHNIEDQNKENITEPWKQFICEGISNEGLLPTNSNKKLDPPQRIYFPLPANEEQKQIIFRLNHSASVVVKGPPGTGKSWTITNLICHLLALGERILVTAQSPRALTILRDFLPEDLRSLCVTALGSSREDQRLLEEGIRKILRKMHEWEELEQAQQKIQQLEKKLGNLEKELLELERKIREVREVETYKHQLIGGYEGTGATIAKRVEQEKNLFDWFPDTLKDQPSFPLTEEEIKFLIKMHSKLTPEYEKELSLHIGDFELPPPDSFRTLLEELSAKENKIQQSLQRADSKKRESLATINDELLGDLYEALLELERHIVRVSRIEGFPIEEILKDLSSGYEEKWYLLQKEINTIVSNFDNYIKSIENSQIHLPNDINYFILLKDIERRIQHFKSGGKKGFFIFKPKVVRETQYVEKVCKIDGIPPKDITNLERIAAYLHLIQSIGKFKTLWLNFPVNSDREIMQEISIAKGLSKELKAFLDVYKEIKPKISSDTSIIMQIDLSNQDERKSWLDTITAERLIREKEIIQKKLYSISQQIKEVFDNPYHPLLNDLLGAIERRDYEIWRRAWNKRESIKKEQEQFEQYKNILTKLKKFAPQLVEILIKKQGDPKWATNISNLKKAWHWASVRGWLEEITDKDRYELFVEKSHILRKQIESTILEIVIIRAWKSFFERLDEATVQSLKAWTRAIARIGKGTGKYVYRHRRAARKYLMECIPKIPAWIMPLHKLYDTIDAKAGLFDTIIIDEASQASLDAIVLFLLAKRIIIVGDDKQNSPESVGVREDDIARLARNYLKYFRFREEFRPDASLFDHAERAFIHLITLREHFRCVPEIIRFSNDLCYTDTPLIPLRQPPPKRLPPLQTIYVEGYCEGEGARIINRIEAEKLVEGIVRCINDETYKDKTMGVIVLQGHAQAQLIERMLSQRLEPKVIEDHKLRCGVPSTFQGDQRDVIFLSLVIAPNTHYRALTRLPDIRRFNVAVSRARDQIWLFHSVKPVELSPEDLRYKLLKFFQTPVSVQQIKMEEELQRLEHACRKPYRIQGAQPEPYDSWFEVDVALELLRRNYQVRPQYEVAGYRIDIVVEGLKNRLAVECDGETWHGPEYYDRDMARQRQLERAGWVFVRIRESEFYTNKNNAIEKIIVKCKELDIQPINL